MQLAYCSYVLFAKLPDLYGKQSSHLNFDRKVGLLLISKSQALLRVIIGSLVVFSVRLYTTEYPRLRYGSLLC